MDLFGLADAENVPVEIVHYAAPALVIVYFICASSVPSHWWNSADSPNDGNSATADAAEPGDSSSTTTGIQRTQPRSSSNLLKWLFILAVLTFVPVPTLWGAADVLFFLGGRWDCRDCTCSHQTRLVEQRCVRRITHCHLSSHVCCSFTSSPPFSCMASSSSGWSPFPLQTAVLTTGPSSESTFSPPL